MTMASGQTAVDMLAELLAAHPLPPLGIGLVSSALAILAICASARWRPAVLAHLRRTLPRRPWLTALISVLAEPLRTPTTSTGVLVYSIVALYFASDVVAGLIAALGWVYICVAALHAAAPPPPPFAATHRSCTVGVGGHES